MYYIKTKKKLSLNLPVEHKSKRFRLVGYPIRRLKHSIFGRLYYEGYPVLTPFTLLVYFLIVF